MQNSTGRWQLIFTGLAVAIAVAAGLIATLLRNTATEQTVEQSSSFGSNHFNSMKTDTFAVLVSKAYDGPATVKQANGMLEVEIKGEGPAREFYNGNEALLKFRLNDHGFELKYLPETQSLKASFRIDEKDGVNVPNDILIKLMDKTTGTYHVDNKK